MLFWVDSQKMRYAKQLEAKKNTLSTIDAHNKDRVIPNKQKREKDNVQDAEPEEPRPWILFSIIYYLAMIRESGARHSPQQKATSKKKSKKIQKEIPQKGIIFTYAS
jgi:hypothetical protein